MISKIMVSVNIYYCDPMPFVDIKNVNEIIFHSL